MWFHVTYLPYVRIKQSVHTSAWKLKVTSIAKGLFLCFAKGQGIQRPQFMKKKPEGSWFIPYIRQAPADIPITIRSSIVQIPIESAIVGRIRSIPITAQFSYTN